MYSLLTFCTLYATMYSSEYKRSSKEPMASQDSNYPKVRITKKAHEHLAILVPVLREKYGLNTSMTDLVSELILSQPIPNGHKSNGNGKKSAAFRQPSAQAEMFVQAKGE